MPHSPPINQKVVIADIITEWGGFYVEKIITATDVQLSKLLEKMCIYTTDAPHSAVIAHGCLRVIWSNNKTTSLKNKTAIVKIINQIFFET